MSIYYKYNGKLNFADEAAAKKACETLLNDSSTVFFTIGNPEKPPAAFNKKNVIIATKGFAGGEVFEDTESVLRKLARIAIGGKILIIYEGSEKESFYILASGKK